MIRTKRTDQSKQITGINITPFTDVCLVLLIIFMVTATSLASKESGFNIPLPKASKTAVLPAAPLVVRIEKGPRLFLNNKPVTWETLGPQIKQYSGDYGDEMTVVIKADENLPYRLVIKTIDIAGQAGASETLLATRTPDEAKDK